MCPEFCFHLYGHCLTRPWNLALGGIPCLISSRRVSALSGLGSPLCLLCSELEMFRSISPQSIAHVNWWGEGECLSCGEGGKRGHLTALLLSSQRSPERARLPSVVRCVSIHALPASVPFSSLSLHLGWFFPVTASGTNHLHPNPCLIVLWWGNQFKKSLFR